MYTRVNPVLVSRGGRKCSRFGLFIGAFVIFSVFCFCMTFVSDGWDTMGEGRMSLRQGLRYHKPQGTTVPYLAELPTWGVNQSTNLADYLDLQNVNSFLIQPSDIISPSTRPAPSYCGVHNVKLLILVASAPPNFVERQAIRETWGSKKDLSTKSAKLLFVMGRTENETTSESVIEESEKYDDIVQEDFLDSYHNLTLKSIAMLKWVNLTCFRDNVTTSFPDHVLKVDDDIFVNIDRLFNVIRDLAGAKMIGRLTCGAEPVTDPKSKLYMPKYLYPARRYPGYLSGTAYLLTGKIIPDLLKNALKTRLIHIEDIYITGILAKQSGIYPEDSIYFTYLRVEPSNTCLLKHMVSSHHITPTEMHQIWKSFHLPLSNCTSISPANKKKWFRKAVPRIKNMNKRLKKICLFPV